MAMRTVDDAVAGLTQAQLHEIVRAAVIAATQKCSERGAYPCEAALWPSLRSAGLLADNCNGDGYIGTFDLTVPARSDCAEAK